MRFHFLKHAREVFTFKEVELGVKSFVQDHSQKYNPDDAHGWKSLFIYKVVFSGLHLF